MSYNQEGVSVGSEPKTWKKWKIIVVAFVLILIIIGLSTSNPSGNEMAGGSAAPASPENAKSPATAFPRMRSPEYSNFIFTCKQLHRLDKEVVDEASFYTTNAYQNAIDERLQGLRNMSDFPKMQSDLGKLQQAIRGRDVFKFLSLWEEVLVSCENVTAPDP
jgi:hypothetical protein